MIHQLKKLMAFLLAALTLLLTACSDTPKSSGDETWTLCLYLCGSNLETKQGWATKTIKEITGTELPDNVNVVIKTGGAQKWRTDGVSADETACWVIENGELTPVSESESASMGDAETLSGFLTFCDENYPADHTAVVLWDHGGGPLKGACFDENNDYEALTLPELGEALQAGVDARGGKKYDLVGFDACLMGSLETAALLKDYADYMIASEEIEPGSGWDYTAPLAAMGEKKTPAEVASSVCDGYKAKCESKNKAATATLAAIDLSKIDGVISLFTTALRDLESACGNEEDMLRTLTARSRTVEAFGGMSDWEGMSNLIDLYDLADSLYYGENGSDAWKNLTDALDDAVVSCINGESTSSANGLSIWYPRAFDKNELDEYTSVTPLTEYGEILTDLLDVRLGQVVFEPGAVVTDDGKISVQILSAAKNAVSYIQVSNWELNFAEMVVDQNVGEDWDSYTFTYDPAKDQTLTINGMVLDIWELSSNGKETLYTCPAIVNGESCYLRIAHRHDTGEYELLGVWKGVMQVTGHADRMLEDIQPGDKLSAESLVSGEVRETVTVGDQIELSSAALPDGTYEMYFVAHDFHGKAYPSANVTYELKGGKVKLISVE